MALDITLETKTVLAITNDDKPTGGTWADFTIPWEDATSPWSNPGIPIIKEDKNNLSITNETKN